jgi:hypothetical protein
LGRSSAANRPALKAALGEACAGLPAALVVSMDSDRLTRSAPALASRSLMESAFRRTYTDVPEEMQASRTAPTVTAPTLCDGRFSPHPTNGSLGGRCQLDDQTTTPRHLAMPGRCVDSES